MSCNIFIIGKVPLEHKTFRRYTIRAKRGGSQSSYDTSGRRPKSMGAQLRRYGEQVIIIV
jgi:Bacteroidetes VLRF1 release factor